MSGLGTWDNEQAAAVDIVEDVQPALYFESLDQFVAEMIIPVFRRKVGERGSYRWAAKWWEYPEAVLRLEALWRAWEHLRLDPALGMSIWLRDHADPHLAVLFSPDGPFGKSTDTSDLGESLPHEPPPAELFHPPSVAHRPQ